MTDRVEVHRTIAAPSDIFAVLADPQGHVAIDATGMLQDADGDRVRATGDSFVVHIPRPHGQTGLPATVNQRLTHPWPST